jgi:hypothetical protein
MANVLARRRPRTTATTPEALRAAGRPFERLFDVRLRLDRLDDQEQDQFAELAAKTVTEAKGVNLAALGKRERGKLESLLEKASGQPGLFDKRRAETSSRAELDALARRARRPAERPILKTRGAVVLERPVIEGLFAAGKGKSVDLCDLGCFVWILSMFANPDLAIEPRGGRVDPDGPTIHWNREIGFLRRGTDRDGKLGINSSLKRLERLGLVELGGSGRERSVRPGRYGRAILKGGEPR